MNDTQGKERERAVSQQQCVATRLVKKEKENTQIKKDSTRIFIRTRRREEGEEEEHSITLNRKTP